LSSTTSTTSTSSTTTFVNGVQYGFFFDQSRCFACKACAVACRDWLDLPAGPVKPLRVYEYEKGVFPSVRVHIQWVPCYHCENPPCVPAAKGAMMKEGKFGAVLIDPSKANTSAMRDAWNACPYGSIVFDSDSPEATAYKCNMCIDRLTQNELPRCVESCPVRALDFGPLSVLETKYGSSRDLEDLPSSTATGPAVIFKAHLAKKTLVTYDQTVALPLLAKRDPYPALFNSPSDETQFNQSIIGRSQLVLKPSGTAQFMKTTQHDEG
jgi:anaerobic dimethyl sulfoxide reductase subunit B (iron-sulfur subunit)